MKYTKISKIPNTSQC